MPSLPFFGLARETIAFAVFSVRLFWPFFLPVFPLCCCEFPCLAHYCLQLCEHAVYIASGLLPFLDRTFRAPHSLLEPGCGSTLWVPRQVFMFSAQRVLKWPYCFSLWPMGCLFINRLVVIRGRSKDLFADFWYSQTAFVSEFWVKQSLSLVISVIMTVYFSLHPVIFHTWLTLYYKTYTDLQWFLVCWTPVLWTAWLYSSQWFWPNSLYVWSVHTCLPLFRVCSGWLFPVPWLLFLLQAAYSLLVWLPISSDNLHNTQ